MCLSMWYENDVPLIPWQEVSDNAKYILWPWNKLITGYRKEQPVQFEKPTVILEYTKFMGGVDRADQYCGCYGFTRRSY